MELQHMEREAGKNSMIQSVRALYINDSSIHWKDIPNEKMNWELLIKALDLFHQRCNSLVDTKTKLDYQSWYDLVDKVGRYYYR